MTTEFPPQPALDDSSKQELESALAQQPTGMPTEVRHALVQEVVSRDLFIDPLIPDDIIKAYKVLQEDPDKIVGVLVASFRSYCRRCIQETAVIQIKNELVRMLADEADRRKLEVTQAIFDKFKADPAMDRLTMMLIFKQRYWQWVRYGLKDIFDEQRMMPGNPLNQYLNTRFYLLKDKKKFNTVADLVTNDIVEIVNRFKTEITKHETRIFPPKTV